MNEEEIAIAKREKKSYVTAFYVTILVWVLSLPFYYILPDRASSKYIEAALSIVLILFQVIVTWRFSRAIQIRKIYAVLNAFLAVTFFVIQVYFLLRLYCKRTRIGISFLLKDRESTSSSNQLIIVPLVFVGVFVILHVGVVTYSVFTSPDIAKPNEEGVTYIHERVPQSENAYFDLQKSSASFFQTKIEEELLKEHVEGKKWDERFVRSMLANNERAIACFFDACRKEKFDDPTILFQIDNSTPIPRIGYMVSISKLAALRGIDLWRNGHQREGLESLVMLCDLGATIQNSQVGMIQYMISVAMTNIGLKAMNECLRHGDPDPAVLKSAIAYLERLDLGTKGMKSAYAVEYQTLCNLALKPLTRQVFNSGHWYPRMLARSSLVRNIIYKPNTTMQLYADFFRERIAELDGHYSAIDKDAAEHYVKRLNMKSLDNIAGKIVISIAVPKFKLAEKIFEAKALRIATLTNFALHAYKLERGYIANSILDMSPKHLMEIPLDPFDGKPLRYSKEKSIVYSVGKNLTDVGGSEGDDWPKMDDPTIKIVY